MRLKPLGEYRTLFEEPGRFLMIPSEEITDRRSVHVNATNLLEFIPPQGGPTTRAIVSNNVDAVHEQRRRTGQAMFPHVNHPNFQWAITAEDLAGVERLQFFEVYNGHPSVHNEGDATRAGLERAWDIIADQPPVTVVLRFVPEVAARVREATWHPSQALREEPDGSLTWSATVAGTIEIRLWILQWGSDVEVLEPADLREDVAATLERALTRYR